MKRISLVLLSGAAGFVLVAGVQLAACSGTPSERAAKAARASEDLCKLRAAARMAEEAYPDASAEPGSVRAQIEAAEDAFCAARVQADAAPE